MTAQKHPAHMLAAAALAGLAPTVAHAGAFNQQAGHGQVIVTTTFTQAGEAFDTIGRFSPASNFRKFETTALVEYGFTDWLTGIVKPSFDAISASGATSASYSGLGMTEIGAQARVAQFGSSVLAVQGTVRVPGSTDRSNPVLIGSTRVEEDLRVLFGHGFKVGGWDGFIDLQAGYRWRGGGPPDELRFDATLGLRPVSNWTLLLQSFNEVSQSSNSIAYPAYSLYKLQASVVHDFSKEWSAQVGFVTTVAGRSALRERGVLAAVWRRF